MLRHAAHMAVCSVGGLLVGSTLLHDHPIFASVRAVLDPAVPAVDASSASQLAAAAVRLANNAGGLCVLSTISRTGGVSSRMIQPLPAACDANANDDVSIHFHTTRRSRKFAELEADSRCTLTYINPATLTCVSFIGEATRLGRADESELSATWPLLPPLQLLYASEEGLSDFSGWRMRPARVQIVSVPAALGGGPRADWAPPEIERKGGHWSLLCKGGMQGV